LQKKRGLALNESLPFHGSNVKIESIDLSKSGSFKDFGGKPIVSEFKYSENYFVAVKLQIKKFDKHTFAARQDTVRIAWQ